MDPDTEKARGEEPNPEQPKPSADFPDGGLKAWSVVVGAFFGLFVSFGWTNCTSIFPILLRHQITNHEDRRWPLSRVLRSKSVARLVTQHRLMDTSLVDVYDVHYCRS